MYYGNIKNLDIANGPGVRVSLFVSGCENACKGCFQPETWNPCYGKEFTVDTKNELFDMVDHLNVDGLTILGGDPLYPGNYDAINRLIHSFRISFAHTKTIWLYTGYTIDHFVDDDRYDKDIILSIFYNIDWMVDGKFVEELKDPTLQFRGSSNQRLIDMSSFSAWSENIDVYHKYDELSSIQRVKIKKYYS